MKFKFLIELILLLLPLLFNLYALTLAYNKNSIFYPDIIIINGLLLPFYVCIFIIIQCERTTNANLDKLTLLGLISTIELFICVWLEDIGYKLITGFSASHDIGGFQLGLLQYSAVIITGCILLTLIKQKHKELKAPGEQTAEQVCEWSSSVIDINSITIDLDALAQKYDNKNITKTKSDMLLYIREETGIELEEAKKIVHNYFLSLSPTPEMKQRIECPTALSLVCMAGFIGSAFWIMNTIIISLTVHVDLHTLYLGFSGIISFAFTLGIWKMKKWAVYAYTGFVGINQIVLLTMGVWNFSALAVPVLISAVSFLYIKKMG